MTYIEAKEKALKAKWKLGYCSEGDSCWCRTIIPEDKIEDSEGNEIWIIGSGEVCELFAGHIVKLHNDSIRDKTW